MVGHRPWWCEELARAVTVTRASPPRRGKKAHVLTSHGARRLVVPGVLAIALVLFGVASAAATSPSPDAPRILGAGSSGAIPGRYIVALKDTPSLHAEGLPAGARTLAAKYGGTVGHVYQTALRGFSTAMSEAEAKRLATDPDVSYVEQDVYFTAEDTQENPSWGLDRVDQHAPLLDQSYSYDVPDTTVNAYVLDTGIRVTHADFGGRASYGWNTNANLPLAIDCNGHGTEVASALGGSTYGVAKNVHLVAVKVSIGCTKNAAESDLVAGIDWVAAHVVKPAVANLSFA